jgi:hypothetical protein
MDEVVDDEPARGEVVDDKLARGEVVDDEPRDMPRHPDAGIVEVYPLRPRDG